MLWLIVTVLRLMVISRSNVSTILFSVFCFIFFSALIGPRRVIRVTLFVYKLSV